MRVEAPCPTCPDAILKPGHIWLGGDDYLVCPTCNGTQRIEIAEEVFTPKARTISIPGVGTIQAPVHHPTFERLHA